MQTKIYFEYILNWFSVMRNKNIIFRILTFLCILWWLLWFEKCLITLVWVFQVFFKCQSICMSITFHFHPFTKATTLKCTEKSIAQILLFSSHNWKSHQRCIQIEFLGKVSNWPQLSIRWDQNQHIKLNFKLILGHLL